VITLNKVSKQDIIDLMVLLKARGYTQAELAVKLNRNPMTIWRWGAKSQVKCIPHKSDYEALQKLTEEDKEGE
jgi:transcriptional regulator with XRE-family HTH domain